MFKYELMDGCIDGYVKARMDDQMKAWLFGWMALWKDRIMKRTVDDWIDG